MHEIIPSGFYISCFGNNFLNNSNDSLSLVTRVVRDTPFNNGNCFLVGLKFDFPSISSAQLAIKLRQVFLGCC